MGCVIVADDVLLQLLGLPCTAGSPQKGPRQKPVLARFDQCRAIKRRVQDVMAAIAACPAAKEQPGRAAVSSSVIVNSSPSTGSMCGRPMLVVPMLPLRSPALTSAQRQQMTRGWTCLPAFLRLIRCFEGSQRTPGRPSMCLLEHELPSRL